MNTLKIKLGMIALTAILLVPGGEVLATSELPPETPVASVTTNPATSITTSDATLNGTLGSSAATSESFWVSTSTFDVSTPNIPANVYSTPVLDPVAANGSFTHPLSIVTTNGIITGGANVNMPAITPGTTYYYVAWAYIDGTWIHGEIVSFQTATPVVESATLTLVKNSLGGDGTFNFNLTGSTSTSTSLTTVEGYATTTVTLNVGETTISESGNEGWDFTSANCIYDGGSVGSPITNGKVITVSNGNNVTCTFTNTNNTVGSIRVIKNVVASNGETDVEDNRTFTVILDGKISREFSENSNGLYEYLKPGFYTITEATSTDYDLVSISPDANPEEPGVQIYAGAGTTTVVTITNKQRATPAPAQPAPTQGPTGGGNIVGWSTGSVLGASTDTGTSTVNNQACTILLTKFMRRGQRNDTEEVKKLQTFLNSQNLGITIPVTGFFGAQTENAVKLFQTKYAADVLTPWGLTAPTGYVYKTTLRWINHLACPSAPLPPLSL
jgi:hypothetical protein